MEVREVMTMPIREMRLVYMLIQMTIMKIVYWMMFWIPAWKAEIVASMNQRMNMSETGMKVEQWQDSIVSLQAWLALSRAMTLDARKKVKLGGPAFDANVVSLDGKEKKLLDFENGARPLVVVFGSCT